MGTLIRLASGSSAMIGPCRNAAFSASSLTGGRSFAVFIVGDFSMLCYLAGGVSWVFLGFKRRFLCAFEEKGRENKGNLEYSIAYLSLKAPVEC